MYKECIIQGWTTSTSVNLSLPLLEKCLIIGSSLIFWRLLSQLMELLDKIYQSDILLLHMCYYIMLWVSWRREKKVNGVMSKEEMENYQKFSPKMHKTMVLRFDWTQGSKKFYMMIKRVQLELSLWMAKYFNQR